MESAPLVLILYMVYSISALYTLLPTVKLENYCSTLQFPFPPESVRNECFCHYIKQKPSNNGLTNIYSPKSRNLLIFQN